MSNDPRIHRHTFVNGRCEVCSLDAEDLRPHEHVFDVNWNCTICRLSYKTIYGNNHDPRMQMTTQPDIDAIAKEALDQIWDSPDGVTKAQDIIVAAIRRAQVELKQEYAEAIAVLKSVEWQRDVDGAAMCAECGESRRYGHSKDCKLAKAIGK